MTSDNAHRRDSQATGTTSDNTTPSPSAMVDRDYQFDRTHRKDQTAWERQRAEADRLYAAARRHATAPARS